MSKGTEALLAYGYKLIGDTYMRPERQTQIWRAARAGFLRYDPGNVPIPHHVREEFEGREGLNSANPEHSDFFDWVWPDAEVAHIYNYAAQQRALGWPDENEKVDDGAGE